MSYLSPHSVLKNKILSFSLNPTHELSTEDFLALISGINDFSKNYKRKPKQLRRVPDQNKALDLLDYPENPQDSDDDERSIFEKEDS